MIPKPLRAHLAEWQGKTGAVRASAIDARAEGVHRSAFDVATEDVRRTQT